MSEKVVREVSIDLSDYFQQTKQYILAKKICDSLFAAGFKAYFAGGCVRDAILKRRFNDIDVATNALPEQIEKLFIGKVIPVGKKFGILIIQDQGEQIEVATFRRDGKYEDGRRPESIEYADEVEDAQRRDFTINALFYDVRNKKILDYVDGLKDIQQKKVRTVGDPQQRFSEDYLRVLRLFRFADSLAFTIDIETLKSALELKDNIQGVSLERRREELLKSFKDTSNSLKLVELYSQNNLWKFYLGVENLDLDKNLFKEKPIGEEEVLSCLLWNVPHYKELLKGLRISHQVFKSVVTLLQFKYDLVKIFSYNEGKLRYLCLSVDFYRFMKLAKRTVLDQELDAKITSYYNLADSYIKDKPKPLLRGEDLKDFFQGKDLGEALELSFQEQLLNPGLSKESLLEKIKKK